MANVEDRINSTLSRNSRLEANCSTGFVNMESSRRRMHLRLYARCSTRSITSIRETLSTEVRTFGLFAFPSQSVLDTNSAARGR